MQCMSTPSRACTGSWCLPHGGVTAPNVATTHENWCAMTLGMNSSDALSNEPLPAGPISPPAKKPANGTVGIVWAMARVSTSSSL